MPPGQPMPGAGSSGPRAGFGLRFVGLLIDAIITGIPGWLIGVASGSRVGVYGIGSLVGLAYSVYLIGSPSGQTIGMKVMSIRAIDAQTGGQVEYSKAFIRWLVSLASGFVCFLGYFWMLWDPEKQTWHDKVAGTFVVPTSAYPVANWPG
jgi:uncharacterized RDD family membrane protein YckC